MPSGTHRASVRGRRGEIDVDDLRDDVAGALDDDRVADAQVLAVADRLAVGADPLDVVLVVERRVGDDDAADGDRLEPATGVSEPVRPTWMSMPRRIVCACSAANLCAIAQRGLRETKPSRACRSRRSTL